jgi:type IV pilus assembly protein PilY1
LNVQEIAMLNRITSSGLLSTLLLSALLMLMPGWHGWQTAQANATNIATFPIFAGVGPDLNVKPNLMFVLDDSGSMNDDFMPDDASNFKGAYGFVSSQCNGQYYNPNTLYSVPVDASGNSFTPSVFNNAPKDGFGLTPGNTDLSSNFVPYNGGPKGAAAFYYVYSGTETTPRQQTYYDTASLFYTECNTPLATASSVFTKVVVDSNSGPVNGPVGKDERLNFANWYTYYRTRMQMMKSAAGLAFKQISDQFRVGFMTINDNKSPAFLNIKDFDSSQKAAFYGKLYESIPSNSTPLREALANVGRLYAGKITTLNATTVTDPVQYACQQNYVLLSTDGFWNGTDSNVKKIDGTTTMGNEDGALSRPFLDGSKTQTTVTTTYQATEDRQTLTPLAKDTQYIYTGTQKTIGASCTPPPINPNNTSPASMSIGLGKVASVGAGNTNPGGATLPSPCRQLGNTTASRAWICSATPPAGPAVSASSVLDSKADKLTWYLVTDITGQTGCKSANQLFGAGYSTTAGVCPLQTTTGNNVTTVSVRQTELVDSQNHIVVDRWAATQTTSTVTTDGVTAAPTPLAPAAPTFKFLMNISDVTTPAASTCTGTVGGVSTTVPGPCPDASVWGPTGTATTVCTATANLPTPGITGVTRGAPSTVGNTTAVKTTSNQQAAAPVPSTLANPNPVTSTVGVGGVANTLADTAAYYYNTNLRTSALGNCTGPIIAPSKTANDLCAKDLVPANGFDTATWQHMTTFTLGLGTRGRMVFGPKYMDFTSPVGTPLPGVSDYYAVAKGDAVDNGQCSWRDALTAPGSSNGKPNPCNWPVPGSNQIENVDDLWHAAVNGHGNYFAATSPGDLSKGLTSALNQIINTPRPGTASAAATTNPLITSTNNFQFSSYFETISWSGELIRQTIDLSTHTVPFYDPKKPDPLSFDWSANTVLDNKAWASRNIYTAGNSGLIPFTWTDLSNAGLDKNFKTPNISSSPPALPNQLTGLSQFCGAGTCLSAPAQANSTISTGGAGGEALVNYLRGDRSREEGQTTAFYRFRKHVLGDIVSAQPQYVGPPNGVFSDSGYSDFVSQQSSRKPIVYAAANDGMLHAFAADTGDEVWAYVPSFVLPRLYTLADFNYSTKHQYFVEGTPNVGDFCPNAPSGTCNASQWKTILVAGLNDGGKGYYALDITDPSKPKLLWEFTDDNMGLTFGKPQITKLDSGQWVVMVTSGYNNCPFAATTAQQDCVNSGTGTGQGYLYVLDAGTGKLVTPPVSTANPVATSSGGQSSPSGLAQIIAQAGIDNVTTRVYGGDLNGNLWRFNVDTAGTTPAGFKSHLIASFVDAAGNPQPITERPQVTTVNGLPIVYVGTGRYLGTGDVGSKLQQSFYAVKDNILDNITFGNIRKDTSFINLTAVDGLCPVGADITVCQQGQVVRLIQGFNGATLRDATKSGWYVDFPAGAGELSFTDPKLVNGTVTFATSVPSATTSSVCEAKITQSDGLSFAYQLDFLTGGTVGTTTGVIATSLGTGISTAPQIEQFTDGSTIAKFRLSTGQENGIPLRFNPISSGLKRVSWRELISP